MHAYHPNMALKKDKNRNRQDSQDQQQNENVLETINPSPSPNSAILLTIPSKMDTLSTDVKTMNDNISEMTNDINELKRLENKMDEVENVAVNVLENADLNSSKIDKMKVELASARETIHTLQVTCTTMTARMV